MISYKKKECGYDIKKNENLIGKVDGQLMRKSINEFFEDPTIKSTDTLNSRFTQQSVMLKLI